MHPFRRALPLALLLTFAAWLNSAGGSPGPLDATGGHRCIEDCRRYGLRDAEYHVHTADRGYTNRYGEVFAADGRKLSAGLPGGPPLEALAPRSPGWELPPPAGLETLAPPDAGAAPVSPQSPTTVQTATAGGRIVRVHLPDGRLAYTSEVLLGALRVTLRDGRRCTVDRHGCQPEARL